MLPVDDILSGLNRLKGVVKTAVLDDALCHRLYHIELAAEKKAFMGMGRVFNSGIREVLASPLVLVCFTNRDYHWGCHSHMVLKKEDEIVGEEVHDPHRIRLLKQRADVWFLHRNFVIYKGRVDFPRDVVEKRCFFEYPAVRPDSEGRMPDTVDYLVSYPTVPGDLFLKETLYDKRDDHGLGTALYGIRPVE